MSKLVLIRHGESEWNAKGIWTGWRDIGLTDKGRQEAKTAANLIRDIAFDRAYTSDLVRASESLEIIKKELHLSCNTTVAQQLKERDYGDYTGKNKWEIRKELGESAFLKLRRGWNDPVAGGENLKRVYERVVPYYLQTIEPELKNGKNVLVVAHGNSIRALVKYLEHISDEGISAIEFVTGEIIIFTLDESGRVTRKENRLNSRPGLE